MNRITFILIVLIILWSCNSTNKLFFEKPFIKENQNPYNYYNKIFTSNKEYIFDYLIIKNLDTLKYKLLSDTTFILVSKNDNSKNLVKYLSINTLKDKGPIFLDHNDYNQSEIMLSHLNSDFTPQKRELTGVIENKENMWLHPFRANAFQILQFSPFPYLKYNSNSYYWDLKIGTHWEELTDIEWKGSLKLKCKYFYKGKTKINTPLGNLEVIKTDALGKSKIGINKLTSYFNENFGFVKLVYDLSNNQKMVITLIKVNDKD